MGRLLRYFAFDRIKCLIFFRGIKKDDGIDTFDRIIKHGAIERLSIKTEEDRRSLREAIRKEVAKRKESKPITEWSEEPNF